MNVIKQKSIKQYPNMFFGEYVIPNAGKPFNIYIRQPIEWIVLEYNSKAQKALIITKYAIDSEGFANCPIFGRGYETSWKESYLREWLNNDFLSDSFNDKERSRILSGYTPSGKRNCPRTIDKVFLLSLDEVKKYFPNKHSAASLLPMVDDLTATGSADHPINITYYPAFWWTRTVSHKKYLIKVVDPEGEFCDFDSNSDETGVRPAMWIKI